jgi:hypothetical protein
MTLIPLPGSRALSRAAARTRVVRAVLAAVLVLLVLAAALAARHPTTKQPTSLPVRSGDMVVLDLSASISSDTFSRIGQTLRTLVATHGRYGLVIFSNVAYEALPPGSPASALEPLIRYFTVPTKAIPGGATAIPLNPWTNSFSFGTRISAGLDLAHRILVADGLPHARVVLISDLADDPADLQQLNQVATSEYGRGRTRLGVVALNATPDDEAFFRRLTDAAITDAKPAPSKPAPPTVTAPTRLPVELVAAILLTLLVLAGHTAWSARLRLDTVPGAP